jgi:hypothetical protein
MNSPLNNTQGMKQTLWLPCFKACCARRSQHSGRSIALAVSSATSKFPHSIARSNLVFLSWTKCSAICTLYEPSIFQGSALKTNLRKALLLKICNNALAKQCRRADDMEHLVVVVAQEREFEAVLSRVECDSAWTC